MSELKINDIILFSDKRRYTKLEGKIGIVIGVFTNTYRLLILGPKDDSRLTENWYIFKGVKYKLLSDNKLCRLIFRK